MLMTVLKGDLAAAKKEIILIDNYVDLSILQRLAKKKKGVNVIIYTDPKTKLIAQDIQIFNSQYPTLTWKKPSLGDSLCYNFRISKRVQLITKKESLL